MCRNKRKGELTNMAAMTKPSVFEISVKTKEEKKAYENMCKPVLSREYINKCIAVSNSLRKKGGK